MQYVNASAVYMLMTFLAQSQMLQQPKIELKDFLNNVMDIQNRYKSMPNTGALLGVKTLL